MIYKFISRVSSISSNATLGLNLTASRAFIKNIIRYDSKLQTLREIIINLLISEVKHAKSGPHRLKLIQLKRDVYNYRVRDNLEIDNYCFSTLLHNHFSNFQKLQKQKNELLCNGEKKYKKELVSLRQKLKLTLQNHNFQNGLLLSSKSLYYAQKQYRLDFSRGSKKLEKIELGLIRYLSRMSLKAVPYSTFCKIVPGHFTSDKSVAIEVSGKINDEISNIKLNKVLFKALRQFIFTDQKIMSSLSYELNPSISKNNRTYLFVQSKKNKEIIQKLVTNQTLEKVILIFSKSTPLSYSEIIKYMSADCLEVTKEVVTYLDKLIAIGFLTPNLGISNQDVNWSEKLQLVLNPIKSENANDISNVLSEINKKIELYKKSAVSEREKIIDSITKITRIAFDNLKIPIEHLPDPIIYHDLSSNGCVKIDKGNINEIKHSLVDFVNLSRCLDPNRVKQLKLRCFYDLEYGTTTGSIPILKFYTDYFTKSSYSKSYLEKNKRIKNSENQIEKAKEKFYKFLSKKWMNQGKHIECLNLTKDDLKETFSCEDGNRSDCDSISFIGTLTTSANNIDIFILSKSGYFAGYGKFFSRFLYSFPESTCDKFKYNNKSEYLVAEIRGDNDFNGNLHPPLLPFEIAYPTEERVSGYKPLSCHDIVVSPDFSDNDKLCLIYAPTGKEILPIDLGLLNTIYRPPFYQLLISFGKSPSLLLSFPITFEDEMHNTCLVSFRPRIVFNNNIILTRKCWTLNEKGFPSQNKNETDYRYLIRIHSWRKKSNIPNEFFLRILIKLPDSEKDKGPSLTNYIAEDIFYNSKNRTSKKKYQNLNKPQYINLDNPFLVKLFGNITKNIDLFTAIIEECLPNPKDMFQIGNDKYASEQIIQIDY